MNKFDILTKISEKSISWMKYEPRLQISNCSNHFSLVQRFMLLVLGLSYRFGSMDKRLRSSVIIFANLISSLSHISH